MTNGVLPDVGAVVVIYNIFVLIGNAFLSYMAIFTGVRAAKQFGVNEMLGGMIGGALVGTFLGVFMAYGLVAPFALRLTSVVNEEGAFYKIIQAVLVAHLHGNAAQISVEIGRGNVPSPAQPSFAELEEALSQMPNE